ncbi:MAG: fused MFS/spermidine synthase, partial [Thaumarchaeota archaeon]|nr:fused MFS/spermidine synthase [Nitrososphaerota archaeon]
FVSGFAVMALELVGSRLITPVFGNSIFTWGSLIGVVLAGLAVGYHYGGKLADKSPIRRSFSSIVFTGGFLIVLIPFITPFVLGFSLSLGLGERYGPLLASTLILGPSTVALGMTSPYAVRIATETLERLGNVAGNLYSLSTIGSILGAFAATFILVPLLDVRSIIFGLGVALMLVALIKLPRIGTFLTLITLLLLLSPLAAVTSGAPIHAGSVYEKETPYSHLDVVDVGGRRTLYLNSLPNSAMDIDEPTRLVFTYTRYFHIGMQMNPEAGSILFVGGGGFSGPKNFLATYPNAIVDVVEIDRDVIETAQRYFEVEVNPRLTVFNADARVHLTQSDRLYDLIVLDAYAKTYVPFHLMTLEFMKLLASRLTPEGIVVSNLIGSLVGDTSDLVRAEYKTISSVFPNVAVFTTTEAGIGAVQNLIVVFTKSAKVPIAQQLESISGEVANEIPTASEYARHTHSESIPVEDVPLLTDGYAPVESLLNPVTGRPYVLEQQEGRLVPTIAWMGSDFLTFTFLVFVAIVWFVYLPRVA